MTKTSVKDAREYLLHFLKGKSNPYEIKHPWRKEWEHVVLHSLRVEAYVLKILAGEQHSLTETEIRLLRLAAILHDIGRLEDSGNHATRGAEIARAWLETHSRERLKETDINRVTEMIADHSNKHHQEADFSKAVLKDADILDEIGAISIFMASNWLDLHSPFFFHDLRKRLIDFEIPFCEQQLSRLNTNAAKEILNEKKSFIQSFISQLDDELQADHQIETLLLASK